MKWRFLLGGAVLAGAGAAAYFHTGEGGAAPGVAPPVPVARTLAEGARTVWPANWPPVFEARETELKRVELTPLEAAVPAAYSMALARQNGDARTPPLQRDAPAPQASAAELADPRAYQAFESRQNMKLYAGFVQAAEADIPGLRRDIERGREAGIAPAQIAKVEEKLRRIEAMRAQLLVQHPELARAAAPR